VVRKEPSEGKPAGARQAALAQSRDPREVNRANRDSYGSINEYSGEYRERDRGV